MYQVHYEDLTSNWESRTSEILGFLGLPTSPALQMPLRKQETRPLSEFITNYHELVSG